MKKFTYRGPSGEVEIKEPLPLRMISSSWFLSLWTLALTLWAGYYLTFLDPGAFLGRRLSPGHANLIRQKSACFTCHSPFESVSTEACLDCHGKFIYASIHSTIPCKQCHPGHTDGAFVPPALTEADCDKCHNRAATVEWKWDPDPKKLPAQSHVPYYPDRVGNPDLSHYPRDVSSSHAPLNIFQHSKHTGLGSTREGKKKFACYQCHFVGPKTMNTPLQDLITMKSCMDCKYHGKTAPGCKSCHNYRLHTYTFHLPKGPVLKKRQCITIHELLDAKSKIALEGPPPNAEPGWKDLPVCETGEPAINYGKLKDPDTEPPYPETNPP
jgi:hypothetical protein